MLGVERLRQFAWASYGMYALSGIAAVLLGAVMPELLHHYHASYGLGGRMVFIQAMGFLLGVPLASRAMARHRPQVVLSGAALIITVAQVCLFMLPAFWLASLVVVLNGIGAGALESIVAAIVLDRFIQQRAIYMSRLEVAFGLGALLLPALTGGLIALGHWRAVFPVIAVFALGLAVWWQTISVPSHEASVSDSRHQDAVMAPPPTFPHRAAKIVVLSLFLSMTVVYVGLEGSVNSFMPSLFIAGLHAKAAIAVLSSTVFWSGMVIGRMAIHWVARHLRYDQYLFLCISVVLTILLIFSQVRSAVPGFVLILGLGLFMAAIYSLVMVYANHTFPGRTHAITGLVTAMAGGGGAIFPPLLGYAMDHIPITGVLWILFGMALLLLLGLIATTLSFQYLASRADQPG